MRAALNAAGAPTATGATQQPHARECTSGTPRARRQQHHDYRSVFQADRRQATAPSARQRPHKRSPGRVPAVPWTACFLPVMASLLPATAQDRQSERRTAALGERRQNGKHQAHERIASRNAVTDAARCSTEGTRSSHAPFPSVCTTSDSARSHAARFSRRHTAPRRRFVQIARIRQQCPLCRTGALAGCLFIRGRRAAAGQHGR